MPLLEHISTRVEITASEIWAKTGRSNSSTPVRPSLIQAAWITHQKLIHTSASCIIGINNAEVDTAAQPTQLLVSNFLCHFCNHFAQPTPWRLCLLASIASHWIHKMFTRKHPPKSFSIQDLKNTIPPGNSGTTYTGGSEYQPT